MPPRVKVDRERIKQLAAKGVKVEAIARRTGVSTHAVYDTLRVKKGK